MSSSAAAQARYGGGALPFSADDPYPRSLGVSLSDTADGNAVLRVDGYVRCKRGYYSAAINDFGPFDGRTIRRSGTGATPLVKGRITYRWSLRARAIPSGFTGTVRISGKRRIPGKRPQRCRARGAQGFRVLTYQTPTAPPTAPVPGARYFGLMDQNVARGAGPGTGIQGSLVAATDGGGQMHVRTVLSPTCPEGQPSLRSVVAIFRRMPVNPADQTFSRQLQYTRDSADKTYAYTAVVGGQVLSNGAQGTGIATVVVTPKDGTPAYTCDSGPRFWYALRSA